MIEYINGSAGASPWGAKIIGFEQPRPRDGGSVSVSPMRSGATASVGEERAEVGRANRPCGDGTADCASSNSATLAVAPVTRDRMCRSGNEQSRRVR